MGVLAGCQALPGDGPAADEILASAGKSAEQQGKVDSTVYEVVDITARTARLVSDFSTQIFKTRFGVGGDPGMAVFGVGDRVRVTIFEAGEGGLFSTVDTKQTALELVVQPDGNVPIPYAGVVRFAGRTAEQARESILAQLRDKAVEPDVIITTIGTDSRNVTVNGDVRAAAQVPLGLGGNRVMDVIAKAGGPINPPYETYVTLTRGSRTATTLLKSIVEHSGNNIFLMPNDQLFLTHDPRTFTMIGEAVTNNRVPFGSNDLNLLEAIALAGGGRATSVNSAGYFVFRFEEAEVVTQILGEQRFHELLRKGLTPDKSGRYPIVYRLDLSLPGSLVVGQTFPVKNRDVIFASRHLAVDLQRFLSLIAQPIGIASGFSSL
jgi:polysaccharide export outer membrane protein